MQILADVAQQTPIQLEASEVRAWPARSRAAAAYRCVAGPTAPVPLRAAQEPPPDHCTGTYILQNVEGRLYCGESDNLRKRLRTHSKNKETHWCRAAYVPVGGGDDGKSRARAVEADVANRISRSKGLPVMKELRDRSNRPSGNLTHRGARPPRASTSPQSSG